MQLYNPLPQYLINVTVQGIYYLEEIRDVADFVL